MSSQTEPPPVEANLIVKTIRDWVFVISAALIIALLVRMFVLQQFYISGPSMERTLLQDNRVLVNKLSYRLHGIGRGDVVVFDRVTTNGQQIQHDDLIKRVIGLSGDVVEIRDCIVLV
ncbi:MAG: signal peptidase I, partial [Ilumatobacteraceae bacterium]